MSKQINYDYMYIYICMLYNIYMYIYIYVISHVLGNQAHELITRGLCSNPTTGGRDHRASDSSHKDFSRSPCTSGPCIAEDLGPKVDSCF